MGRPPPHLFGRDAPTDAEVLEAARLAGIPTPPRDAMASESEAVSNANTASDGMSVQSTRKTSLSVWTPVGEGGQQLSGGEKQRVAIARLAIANPQVALLDEASSALDAGSERDIEQKLQSVIGGRTTIVVSHKLSAMLMSCDRIFVLDQGIVVEEGTPKDLLSTEGSYLQAMRVEDDKKKSMNKLS